MTKEEEEIRSPHACLGMCGPTGFKPDRPKPLELNLTVFAGLLLKEEALTREISPSQLVDQLLRVQATRKPIVFPQSLSSTGDDGKEPIFSGPRDQVVLEEFTMRTHFLLAEQLEDAGIRKDDYIDYLIRLSANPTKYIPAELLSAVQAESEKLK